MRATWTALHHDGRNHLGLRLARPKVNELKRRDVGPEPSRLVKLGRRQLDKKRADFFKGARPGSSARSVQL